MGRRSRIARSGPHDDRIAAGEEVRARPADVRRVAQGVVLRCDDDYVLHTMFHARHMNSISSMGAI